MAPSVKLPATLLALCLSGLLCLVANGQVGQSPPDQTYIAPHVFTGSLYVGTLTQLSPRQATQLLQEFGSAPQQLVLVGVSSHERDDCCASSVLSAQWLRVVHHANVGELAVEERPQLTEDLHELGTRSCVWVREASLKSCDQSTRAWLGQQLVECLGRGVTVCIECPPSSAEATSDVLSESEPLPLGETRVIAQGLSLLPWAELAHEPGANLLPPSTPAAPAQRVRVSLPAEAWVRVRGRELANLSASGDLTIVLPKTHHYPEDLIQRVEPRMVCDLVAARRALAERQQPAFPAADAYLPRMQQGSLVIVGGGGAPAEVWQKFVTLAGGAEARIVVLPTAVPEPESDAAESRILKRFGAQAVRVLPQINRDEVSSAEYLANFEWATGVWFGGGRQWRFVDAYWGTPAWPAIIKVAQRGGVIGGSSAGATIQGDLLVRGHPLGNHVMVADGYRRGLGLLPGVAIDQHFRQRNRFDDLAAVVNRFPQVLGIGIDEATALVVEAPDKCSVIGEGSVWLSMPQLEPRSFVERPSGSTFELNTNTQPSE